MNSYTEQFIELGCLRPGEMRVGFCGVTLHEKIGGRQEDAEYFARLAFNSKNRNRVFSAHYYVDDKQIINTIPEEEIALHSTEYANSNTIAITLCPYIECDTEKLIENAESLITDILLRHNVVTSADKIFKAEDFSEQKSYAEGLLDSKDRFDALSENVQKNLEKDGQSIGVVVNERIYERDIIVPLPVNNKIYPPADTETESMDALELARYQDLDSYGSSTNRC